MRGRLGKIGGLLILALSLSLASCDGGESDDELASVAPPDAPFYAEFAIAADGEQAEAVAALSGRVAGVEDPAGELIAEFDAALAADDIDLSYDEDVSPWLGDSAAVFARTFEPTPAAGGAPDFGAVLEVDDADAALSFLERVVAEDSVEEEGREYEGYDYFFMPGDGGMAAGLIDDRLVFGTEASFMVAVDAAEGESLAESEEYRERTDALSGDSVATIFAEPGAAIEAAIAAGEVERADRRLLAPFLSGPLSASIAAGVEVSEDSAGLELVAMVTDDELETDSPLIESLPAGSWLAMAAPELGPMLARMLDQVQHGGLPGAGAVRERLRRETGLDPRADLLSWLEGAALFVEGTAVPGISAGLIAETSDPEGPRRLLELGRALAERDSGLRSSGPPAGADYGFSLGLPGIGGGAEAGVVDGRLVAVLGGTVAGALDPEATLADDERFAAAAERLGEGFKPGLYLDLPSLFAVAELGGPETTPDYGAAAPYLESLGSLIGGTRVDGDQAVSRWTLTLADE